MAVQTITYGDKSYLNQNADIPATNKVQDTDMNEIKAVVNNNAIILQNNTEISQTEVKIGEDNGKSIYKSIVEFNATGNTITDISSLNIDEVYDYNAICHRFGSSNNDYEKPYYNTSSDYFRCFLRINTNTIETRITTSSAYTTYHIKVTIKYTKIS